MSGVALTVAVVGHTNTGKTSLLRTLTRDVDFGEVSDHPSTTRHVEGAALLVAGEPVVEFYDTPGLEDPIGLLEIMDATRDGRRIDGIELVQDFLNSEVATGPFSQEAKALRQVIASDLAMYVIDVRDRVLAKHRDELEILGRCATPVLPVLNFVASQGAQSAEWKEQLSRVSMHAVAEFDTVVLDGEGEEQLLRKVQSLVDGHHDALERLIQHLREERARLLEASAELVAELAIDVAALVLPVHPDQPVGDAALNTLRQRVREREQRCVDSLLALNRFRLNDVMLELLPVSDGKWGLDLFGAEALRQFGVGLGGAAATGAAAGLAIDAMVGGLSLGAGALTGALVGVAYKTIRSHGRRLRDRARGITELRVDDATLVILLTRQLQLVQALLRRGHASIKRLTVKAGNGSDEISDAIRVVLRTARAEPTWSTLGENPMGTEFDAPRREQAAARLGELFAARVREQA